MSRRKLARRHALLEQQARRNETFSARAVFLALKCDVIADRQVYLLGGVMSGRVSTSYACAYCGEPLPFTSNGINAWRVGDRFVCNEFCADGISADNEPASAFPQPQTVRSSQPID